jgi:hypothetical protein
MVRNTLLKTYLKGRTFYTVVEYICRNRYFANNRRVAEIKEGDLEFKMLALLFLYGEQLQLSFKTR